ncbi:hypothetical protein ACH42_15660 [Endozoicomonas sp. (ex Bugula neritina AB1)]|nr:hypothetical protein ACH42_15660 [Endozoicomonas sp. (ex Bugula neritina AB1)]
MFNRIDTIMLSTLIVLTLSSGWVQIHRQIPQSDTPLQVVVEEVVEVVVPDFNTHVDVREKKAAFFQFMTPLIERENERILATRERVVLLSVKSKLNEDEQRWLLDIADHYRMKNVKNTDPAFFEELLSRVDLIPLSLALVQSANESAWGTSRFARQGNNFFGQWCFDPGCGIVPGSRPAGERYEVRKFDDVTDSVRSYMRNLNSHFKYDGMRELRQKRRQNNEAITGPILAQGLYSYSIRGIDYVEELVSMIASNDLLRYDLKMGTNPES